MFLDRLQRVRTRLSEEGLDWLLVSHPENRRYLSGFTGSFGYLLISQEEALLATDFRYFQQVQEQAPAYTLAKVQGGTVESLASILQQHVAEGARLGFEAEHLTVALYEKLRGDVGSVQWVPTQGLVERLRAVKDPEEVAAIRRAVALADDVLEDVLPTLRPGVTEREVAWRLESAMRERGAEKVSFDLIVASGPNSAKPHAVTTDRPLGRGEPIVMDMGCVVDGYCSDLTRTVILGEPDGRFRDLYDLVLQAQRAAEEGIRPGMSGREADALAREILDAAGYKEEFGHSLGHGVGLEIHELPRLSALAEEPLQEGMVFTVEPGVYIPGWGGIRIEDVAVLRADGVEVLTACTKDPVVPV
ncbi:MAG: M24 family metallopeptidase [Anaerolineae bacterium]